MCPPNYRSSAAPVYQIMCAWHTQPEMPQTCCKLWNLWIVPALAASCQQVAASLLTSSNCSKFMKIRLVHCNLICADWLQVVETT